jgi:5'-nucleotidase / UDP-sugar diphosphatase
VSDINNSRSRKSVTYKTLIFIFLTLLLFSVPDKVTWGSESGELTFTILHTNDEHSALIPHSPAIDHDPANPDDPTLGGFARLATLIEEIKAHKAQEGEPVILFSAGDFLGGTAFGWLAPDGQAAELSIMQEIGYHAVTIGNHEYDYGPEVLADYLLAAGYPDSHQQTVVLASNTRPPQGHPLSERDLLRDSAVIELENGITLGIFGLIGEDAESVASDTGDIEFLDRHQTAQDMIEVLQGSNVDVIVAITHSGLDEDIDLAQNVSGIDVIVGGHSHTVLTEPVIVGDTIIVQAGSLGLYLGQLELAYHGETGEITILNELNNNPYLIPVDGSIAPHPGISLMVDAYTGKLNDLVQQMSGGRSTDILEVVARSHFPLVNQPPLQETPIGNFITDGMRLITQQVTGKRVDIALQANGSIRDSIIPGTMPHAMDAISFYDIVNTIGLGYGPDGAAGYPIASVYLTGEETRRMLEVAVLLAELMGDTYFLQFSGLRYDYNPDNTILFSVPVINQPLPSSRAVISADFYTGEGYQSMVDNGQYRPIQRGDEHLYRLVTDTYILSFLPMVGDLLPHLSIAPKNADGEVVPLDQFDQFIVHWPDGQELKVWQTVVEYAASQPVGADGLPQIPPYYQDTLNRINQVSSFPYIVLVYLLLAVILLGITVPIVLLVKRKHRLRKAV